MGETTRAVIAGIDAPTAGIIAAIITAFAALGARWAPKTRTEAAVDRSKIAVDDVERWRALFEAEEKARTRDGETISRLEGKVEELERALEEEREACDRQITDLSEQVLRLARAVGVAQPQRLFFRE